MSGTPYPNAAGPDILDTPAAGSAVIRGGALRVAGYAVGVGLSVIGVALLARHLGVADFGRYAAVISLVTIAGTVSEAGMTSLGVREYTVLEGERRTQFMRELLGVRIALAAVGAAVAVGFAAVAGYSGVMVAGTLLVGLGLLPIVVQATYGVSLQSRLRLGWVTAIEVLRQGVSVVIVVGLVLLGASLLPFFAVSIVAGIVALAATIPLVRGTVPVRPSFDPSAALRLLRLTLPFAVAAAVGAIYIYVAVVLMAIISTPEETGYFGASFRVFIVLGAIPGLLVNAAFPVLTRAARDDRARLAYALQRLWETAVIVGAGLAVATAVGAGIAIDVVGGADYEPAVEVLRIQAGALFATHLIATWGFALLSLARYRALLLANALALAVSVGLTLALAPSYGANGAAVATLVGEAVLAAAYGVALMRSEVDLRVSPRIVPAVGLACAAAATVLLVPGVPELADALLAPVLYVAALALLGVIPKEIGQALSLRRGRGGPE